MPGTLVLQFHCYTISGVTEEDLQSGAKIIETSYSPPTSLQNNVVSMIPNHSVGLKHSPNIVNGWKGEIVRKDRII